MKAIDNDTVKQLIESELENATVNVEGDGYHYYVTVTSELFAGKSTLQRHKIIYSILNEPIASGALHAVALQTYTPEEQQSQQTN